MPPYAKQMGWTPAAEKDFDIRTVTDSFLGSYHTRSQFIGLKPDSIQAYMSKNSISSEMYIADTGETKKSIYDWSCLDKKDKYSYFQGGVHALMTLSSKLPTRKADQDKLLVVKDSNAHSLLPFLTQHVKDIHVIDIRYITAASARPLPADGRSYPGRPMIAPTGQSDMNRHVIPSICFI